MRLDPCPIRNKRAGFLQRNTVSEVPLAEARDVHLHARPLALVLRVFTQANAAEDFCCFLTGLLGGHLAMASHCILSAQRPTTLSCAVPDEVRLQAAGRNLQTETLQVSVPNPICRPLGSGCINRSFPEPFHSLLAAQLLALPSK
jgi:hypothetical protein